MRTIIVIAAATLASTACGGRTATPSVVAAESAYGSVAAQIAGPAVSVSSILTSPSADPHLFDAGNGTALAIARAWVVVANGAGYDAFVPKLLSSTQSRAHVVTVADALGVRGSGANPHLWYDVPRLGQVARAIAAALEAADPAHASRYRAGLARFRASLAPLRRELARIRSRFAGAPVAATEPVAEYLLVAAGLRDVTPASFAHAIQSGSEAAPAGVDALRKLLTGRRVRVLVYNDQAVSPVTAGLRELALRSGVAVVAVGETLPPGRSLQSWLLGEARALEAALAR